MMRNGEPVIFPVQKEVLPGLQNTYASIGPEWANVLNTPFRLWKAKSTDGGICTPLIAYWPKGIKTNKGGITEERGHVMDIMATCIDLAGAVYPEQYAGKEIIPLEGKSLVSVLKEGTRKGHDYLAFEHFNEKALITRDGWKIIQPDGKDEPWQLYNLNEDRTELRDMAAHYPKKVEEMVAQYEEWTRKALVVPMP